MRDFHGRTRIAKTKAKKRYLKAKKDRKKKRRVAGKAAASAARGLGRHDDTKEDTDRNSEGGDGHEVDSEMEHGVVVDEDGKGAQAGHESQPQRKRHRKKGKDNALIPEGDKDVRRPRKRRKLLGSRDRDPSPAPSLSEAAVSSSSVPSSPVSSSPDPPADSPSRDRAHTHTPTLPPSSLPRFPLPTRPHAPEKSELALQGMDRALARAQLVDPLLSTPLSLSEDSSGTTCLSARMLRRLKDLGIVELFAGEYQCPFQETFGIKLYNLVQTTLLPLLLPLEPQKRSLYLPYDPPCDICVSAPTGSGKTLAYVLPIVEVGTFRDPVNLESDDRVQILSPRAVTRLRALVVLPTRDLVIQVRETFEVIAKGRGLKVRTVSFRSPHLKCFLY